MVKLTIVRGLPGSGKTTFAETLPGIAFEADQFFVDLKGNYKFDGRFIGIAHDWCFSNAVRSLQCGFHTNVSNTFTQLWEMDKYVSLLGMIDGLEIEVYEMCNQYGSIHGIPESKMKMMKDRWEEIPDDWVRQYFKSVTKIN